MFIRSLFFAIILYFIIHYIDWEIITPALLPDDYCYYHFHDIPWWVDLFYMNGASNGHPEGSIFHFFLVVGLSVYLGIKCGKVIGRRSGH